MVRMVRNHGELKTFCGSLFRLSNFRMALNNFYTEALLLLLQAAWMHHHLGTTRLVDAAGV